MPTRLRTPRISPAVRGMNRGPPIFRATKVFYGTRYVTGQTQDATGVALGSCRVDLFTDQNATPPNTFVATMTSDASTGNYAFVVADDQKTYFVRCYKAGTPVFGTSNDGLSGARV